MSAPGKNRRPRAADKAPPAKGSEPETLIRARYRTAAARARKGILAALADLSEELALNTYETQGVSNQLQAVHDRLAVIEPVLKTLENERQRRIGVRAFLNDWRVWFVTLSGVAVMAWNHFFNGSPPSIPKGP